MKRIFVLITALSLNQLGFTETSSSSESSKSETPKENRTTGSVSDEQVQKPKSKLRGRVKGDFKGKDPMIAPDGQSQLPPTDGSRPTSP